LLITVARTLVAACLALGNRRRGGGARCAGEIAKGGHSERFTETGHNRSFELRSEPWY
jgi:hypothetical protein